MRSVLSVSAHPREGLQQGLSGARNEGDDNGGSDDRGGVAAPETADDGAETGDMVAPATPQRAALATPHAACGLPT